MSRRTSCHGSRDAAIARRAALIATILLTITSVAWALFATPSAVPIDRVIANVEARRAEDPDDVDALYTLARAHYLAFINKSPLIPAFQMGRGDDLRMETPPRWMTEPGTGAARGYLTANRATELALAELGFEAWIDVPPERRRDVNMLINEHMRALLEERWQPEPLPVEQVLAHVREARDAFEAIIEQSPDNGLYRLGLASLYDQYVQFREAVAPPEAPELQEIRIERALENYYDAYRLTIDPDRARNGRPHAGLRDLVSYEAGGRYLELAAEIDPNPTAEARQRREQVADGLGALERLPQLSITPLVLSLRPSDGLASLVDEHAEVYFDLDGNDRVEAWTWVGPETGILAWDPNRSGEITSGRQLFGNATWWLLFGDGYRALDTLDDDRDGYISGAELDGLAVWFDRNANGRSEPGEVVPIEDLPVRALGTRPDGQELGALRHSRGLVLADGRVLPTYDWIAHRAGCDSITSTRRLE